MMTPPTGPIEEVDEGTLRRYFNLGQFEEKAQRGELTARVKPGSEHPAPPALNDVPGTISHILQYFDENGDLVAMVHEYVRPDGSLGGAGRRDPKWLRTGNRILKQRRKKPKT
jgi:hypothetical protein